jgi:hypothetical protein
MSSLRHQLFIALPGRAKRPGRRRQDNKSIGRVSRQQAIDDREQVEDITSAMNYI